MPQTNKKTAPPRQKTPTNKRELPHAGSTASRQLTIRSFDVEKRTVEVAFVSETPVPRWYGDEILKTSDGAVRLGRLQNKAAVLFNHNWDQQIGVVEEARIDSDGVGRAVLRFSKGVFADEIFQDIQDGIREKVSVYYDIHKCETEVDNKTGRSKITATDWEPYEISIVSIPADDSVGVGRSKEARAAYADEDGNLTADDTHASTAADDGQRGEEENSEDDGTDSEDDENARSTDEESVPESESDSREESDEIEDEESEARSDEADETEERDNANQDEERKMPAQTPPKDPMEKERKRQADIQAVARGYSHLGFVTELANEYLADGKGRSAGQFTAAILEKVGSRNAPMSTEIGMTDKEAKRFSIVRALRAQAFGDKDARFIEEAAFEIEASAAAAKQRGKDAKGILIPDDVLRRSFGGRRDMNKGTPTAGGNLVGTELLADSFIDLLRAQPRVMQLGAQMLGGLVGQVAIPKLTGAATAYWVAEGVAPTESAETVGQVGLSAKTCAANVDVTRQLLMQSSIDVENMIRNDLTKVVALAIDSAALYGTGSNNQPTGAKLTSGLNTVDFGADAPTWANIVDMETQIAADNADVDQMGYLTNPTIFGGLKTTEKAANTARFIYEDDQVNGYQCLRSTQVASGDVWFGNWSDLVIGMWGGLDLMVNPYAQAKAGIVEVIAYQDIDIALRNAQSLCRGNNTL